MLNWWTIGGTIEINGQKPLKCSNYSLMLNWYAVEDGLICNENFYWISLKMYEKNLSTAEFILDTHILSLEIVRKWIPSN